ncbi:MAG: DUF3108 domain-containing protein [Aquificaceae bacterium]|nr:DUF3108 domain-containing protein [Aquificaceae bacterium]
MAFRIWLSLLFVASASASELKACYRAFLGFLPVAETCISYKLKGALLHVESVVKTVNVGKIAKRVNNKGSSSILLDGLEPKTFEYYQEEGTFKRYQRYQFEGNKIQTLEIEYEGLSEKAESTEEKTFEYRGFVDPYTASLRLYKDLQKAERGDIKIFYDQKEYTVPYNVVLNEQVKTPAGTFNTKVVEVSPAIKTKGLLKPRGNWRLWIDKRTNLPVRMDLTFAIGSVSARLETLEGNQELLETIFKKR